MTREQEMVIKTIRDYMTGEWDRRNWGSTRTYEIKEERISEELEDGSIHISMTRGLEGDEGTMAAVLCGRYNRHICRTEGRLLMLLKEQNK